MVASKNGLCSPNNDLEGQGKGLVIFKATTVCARHYTYVIAFNPRDNSLMQVWLTETCSSEMTCKMTKRQRQE